MDIKIILPIAVAGAGIAYFLATRNNSRAVVYTVNDNGTIVRGTAAQLAARGYVAITVNGELRFVTQTQYNQANSQAGGNASIAVAILNAAGAILPIVATTISTVKGNVI